MSTSNQTHDHQTIKDWVEKRKQIILRKLVGMTFLKILKVRTLIFSTKRKKQMANQVLFTSS